MRKNTAMPGMPREAWSCQGRERCLGAAPMPGFEGGCKSTGTERQVKGLETRKYFMKAPAGREVWLPGVIQERNCSRGKGAEETERCWFPEGIRRPEAAREQQPPQHTAGTGPAGGGRNWEGVGTGRAGGGGPGAGGGAGQRRAGRAGRAQGAVQPQPRRAERGACSRPGRSSLLSGRGRRRWSVSGAGAAAPGSRGGRRGAGRRCGPGADGRAAAPRGPGPGGFVYVPTGGKGPGLAVPLPGGGRRCGALRPEDLPCPLTAGGSGEVRADNGGDLFVGVAGGAGGSTGLLLLLLSAAGAPGQAGLAAPSSGKERYRAGWWECSPPWATTMTLLLNMHVKAKKYFSGIM